MPLDAPVTIATLLNSLFTIVLDPTPVPPNVHRCELRLARMKISIHAPYTKSGSPSPSAWRSRWASSAPCTVLQITSGATRVARYARESVIDIKAPSRKFLPLQAAPGLVDGWLRPPDTARTTACQRISVAQGTGGDRSKRRAN